MTSSLSQPEGQISRLAITGSRLCLVGGHSVVVYSLLVSGCSDALHPASFFEDRTLKFNPSPSFVVYRRYRDLRKMHEALTREMQETVLPPFPAKKWLGNKTKSFIQKRTIDLKTYFKRLMLVKGIGNCMTLRPLLTPDRSIPLTIVATKPFAQADLMSTCLGFIPAGAVPPPEYDAFISLRVKHHSARLLPVDMIIEGKLIRVIPTLLSSAPEESAEPSASCYNGDFLMIANGVTLRKDSGLAFDSNSRSAPGSQFGSFASTSETSETSFRVFRNFLKSLANSCT